MFLSSINEKEGKKAQTFTEGIPGVFGLFPAFPPIQLHSSTMIIAVSKVPINPACTPSVAVK
jgi:hypothetical protein